MNLHSYELPLFQPLSRIFSIWENAKWFLVLDLIQVYLQIPPDEESKDTLFCLPFQAIPV